MNGLSNIEVLLQQVGEINGKIDGVLQCVEDIKADNLRCHADRDDLHHDIGKIKSKQSWMIGLGTGVGLFVTSISALLHWR